MQIQAFEMHFKDQTARYGDQIIVNLINRKGYEERVGAQFQSVINQANNPSIRYEPFDFHKECSKMRWERLSLLMDKLEESLAVQGYYSASPSGNTLSEQKSVVRTNCMDCLDRTNVVQSMLARRALRAFLTERNVLDKNQQLKDLPVVDRALANSAPRLSLTFLAVC